MDDPHNLAPRMDPNHDFGTSTKKPKKPAKPDWVYKQPGIDKVGKGLEWGRDDPNITATPHHGSYDIIPKRGGSAKLLYHKKAPLGSKAPSDGSHRQNLGVHRNVAAAQAVAEKHHASQGAAVAKGLSFQPHKMRPRDSIAHVDHGSYTVSPDHVVRYTPTGGSPTKLGKFGSRAEAVGHAQTHHASVAGKSFRLVSLDDYYDAVVKADKKRSCGGDDDRTIAERGRPKKFPRDMGAAARMKPTSDDDAMASDRKARRDERSRKSLRATVDTNLTLDDLSRAMAAMAAPSGSAKPPKVYLPGVHNPRSPVRPARGIDKKTGVKKTYPTLAASVRPSTSSGETPRVLDAGGATELSNSIENVVIKSEGAEMANVNFNDLFKAELGGDHLVDCPHCDAPITKSDLAKAHKGKVKDLAGKRGKSSAHVSEQFPEGGAMRGGDGRGVVTPSRGVPGAKKTDPAAGVQNGKGSSARKGGNADSSVEEGEDDVGKSTEAAEAAAPAAPAKIKKSYTIRGTDYVQYYDDGSDAALAKAIAEGTLGGTPPTQPLDLNNDLTRLLV